MAWDVGEDGIYPFFDPETQTSVMGHREDFRVEVWPMIFNDRVGVTHRSGYPHSLVAGFCYDKGGAAVVAAIVWLHNWDTMLVPPGFKKVAFNSLDDYRETPTQGELQ